MHKLRMFACAVFSLWILAGPAVFSEEEGPREGVPIKFERFGGFAGVHEKYEIYQDGRISDSKGRITRVPLARVESLIHRIRALDIPNSRRIDLPAEMCSDCFHYRITMRDRSGKIVLSINEPQMGGNDGVSNLARSIRDFVFAQKWK
jgi:hypothetical protein